MSLAQRVSDALGALGVSDNQPIGIACSGGGDSVGLVHLLARTRRAKDLVVLHVDHGLRPESEDDAAFVEALAADLRIESRVVRIALERRTRTSLEAQARDARYEALQRFADELELSWVATGHTLDDQAETVLLRMMRGGSLAGIAPIRATFVRPLLDVSRAQLRDWLIAEGIEWREDSTNNDLRIERNWVRAVVLPLLHQRRHGVHKVLARTALHSRLDEEALDPLARDVFARASVDDAGVHLPSAELEKCAPAVRSRVVRFALRRLGADPSSHDVAEIVHLEPGQRTRCQGAVVWRTGDGVAFTREPLPLPETSSLPAGGAIDLPEWGIRVRVGPSSATAWRWRSPLSAVDVPVIRSRRTGDRVRTPAGTRKVQDVLVDAKVPAPLRDLVPVVATQGGALAVVGLTSYPVASPTVVDVEPVSATWSRKVLWTRANA